MRDDIIVLHAGDVKKALPKVANKPFAWLYLGRDIKQRENISQVPGKGKRYLISELLRKVAHKGKQWFLNLIAELGLRQENRRHWGHPILPTKAHWQVMLCYSGVMLLSLESYALKRVETGKGCSSSL